MFPLPIARGSQRPGHQRWQRGVAADFGADPAETLVIRRDGQPRAGAVDGAARCADTSPAASALRQKQPRSGLGDHDDAMVRGGAPRARLGRAARQANPGVNRSAADRRAAWARELRQWTGKVTGRPPWNGIK